MTEVSAQKLIESGAHYGHQTRRWNPKMAKYIHSHVDGVHIFDLIKTKKALEEALKVISKVASEKKNILILGTKKQAKEKVAEIAQRTQVFYVNERWLGGTLSNFSQIKKSLNKLNTMRDKLAAGEYKKFTKKERLLIEREIARLERFFGGLYGMEKTPDLIIIIDLKREQGAIKEARTAGVETVGIVDTNCDPDGVTYPIPMNDDATRALDYVLDLIAEAITEGKNNSKKLEAKPETPQKQVKVAKGKNIKTSPRKVKEKKSKVSKK
ncbi:30S ribosomal protein S2 [Candidatus Woesebacteria bacterium]|nr:MAG: 30S ribosomal protein S2 [Candidatus Woesebacteria bacterium]